MIEAELKTKLLDYGKTLDCVHCGLCLPHCPTYQETGRETSSPRGRISLMRGVAEGRLALDGLIAREMYFCLGCRACESVCPAGVEYGQLVESMRAEVELARVRPLVARTLERLVLRRVVGAPRTLRAAFALLRAYQRSGLQRLLRASRLLWIAPGLARAERSLPPLADPHRPSLLVPARRPRRGRVAFLTGCVMPELFGAANQASIRVLAENGFEVSIPDGQVCCGALHQHAGDPSFAKRLHARNRSVFRVEEVDALVTNSAGCGASLKESGDELSALVRDISEFLVEAGLRDPGRALNLRVAYDDPCHLLHAQRIAEPPRALLRAIPGLELFDLPGASECCGAAGLYSLTHPATSRRLLERKLAAIRATAPDVVATGNPGCLMQIGAGVREAGLDVAVLHPVELLARAYDAS